MNLFRYNKRAKSRSQAKKGAKNETSTNNGTWEEGKHNLTTRNEKKLSANFERKINQTWVKNKPNAIWQNKTNWKENLSSFKQKKEIFKNDAIENKVDKDLLNTKEGKEISEELNVIKESKIQQNNEINIGDIIEDNKIKAAKSYKYHHNIETTANDNIALTVKEANLVEMAESSLEKEALETVNKEEPFGDTLLDGELVNNAKDVSRDVKKDETKVGNTETEKILEDDKENESGSNNPEEFNEQEPVKDLIAPVDILNNVEHQLDN